MPDADPVRLPFAHATPGGRRRMGFAPEMAGGRTRGCTREESMQLNRERLHRQLNRCVPITAWLPAPREKL